MIPLPLPDRWGGSLSSVLGGERGATRGRDHTRPRRGDLFEGDQRLAVILAARPATEDEVLRGMVDFRELMAATAQQTRQEIMTENALSLSPDDTLSDANK